MRSLRGCFLVAAPTLTDPNFARSVVLIVQHNEEGALGLVVNRPTDTSIAEAWSQVSEKPCHREETLYHGGPCEGVLMVLHDQEDVAEVQVLPGVSFSTEKEHVEWLMEQGDGTLLCFVGYAGWGPGQIESEMAEGSWLVAPADREQVFAPPADQWSELIKQIARAAMLVTLGAKIVPRDPSVN